MFISREPTGGKPPTHPLLRSHPAPLSGKEYYFLKMTNEQAVEKVPICHPEFISGSLTL
jgi:hypothetical protein